MKERRIVVSTSPVTTIRVSGTAHHFFHSAALGKCRAILISPDENLPSREKSHRQEMDEAIDEYEAENVPAAPALSKGDKLKVLMDCGNRLHDRFQKYFQTYTDIPERDYEGRNKAFRRFQRVNDASNRLTRLIRELLDGKESRLLPSPVLCIPKLKNSELRNLQAQYQNKWQSFWDSDLDLMDEDYAEISEMLSRIADEIESRQERGYWS